MRAETLLKVIDSEFYTGVPDSQLKALCDCLMDTYGIDSQHHIITANEGNAAALAAGYYLATGKTAAVYLQNSGLGNIINPVASLLNQKVYGIPCLFIVGWRGEPGRHDEPQHVFQGEVTLKLLEDMDIRSFVVCKETSNAEIQAAMEDFRPLLSAGKSAAFVVQKGGLTYNKAFHYQNNNILSREEALRYIVEASKEDFIVSTTGKISRELFEIREHNEQGHQCDFLTVGSMGHVSSIALGIALQRPKQRVWCIDGDGAMLMHMGAMAVIGANAPKNLIHVVLNNEAHESVGGMPTVAGQVDFPGVAHACGYPTAVSASTLTELENVLNVVKSGETLSFLEVKCSLASRDDLGRPSTSLRENKRAFMNYMRRQ